MVKADITQTSGLKLKEIDRKTNRSEVLDLKIKRGADEFRLVRRWFAEKNDFVSGSQFTRNNVVSR